MALTRRDLLVRSLGTCVFLLPGGAGAATVEELIADFAGGTPGSEGIALTMPEVADNGMSVELIVDAPGAVEILILAPGNPTPEVARASFGPGAGSGRLRSYIRMTRTQEVTALARLADGTVVAATRPVEVKVGGCGA